MFRESVRYVQRWSRLNSDKLQISINTSPVQLQSDALSVAAWCALLQELGVAGSCISIEITEGLLLNASPEVSEKLLAFRDAGIQVAIDDFGIGYSAFSYLKRFDIDYLKIDQAFIRNLEVADQNDLVLSEAIVVMAHKLGLEVIAEGVETEAQCRLLTDIGCDYGQGYLFSKPLPPTDSLVKVALASEVGTLSSGPALAVTCFTTDGDHEVLRIPPTLTICVTC